jgi:hypothetical protein
MAMVRVSKLLRLYHKQGSRGLKPNRVAQGPGPSPLTWHIDLTPDSCIQPHIVPFHLHAMETHKMQMWVLETARTWLQSWSTAFSLGDSISSPQAMWDGMETLPRRLSERCLAGPSVSTFPPELLIIEFQTKVWQLRIAIHHVNVKMFEQ